MGQLTSKVVQVQDIRRCKVNYTTLEDFNEVQCNHYGVTVEGMNECTQY